MHNNSTEGTARILEDNYTRRILSYRNSLDLNQIKQRARNTPALAEMFYKSSTGRQMRQTEICARRPQRITVASSLGNMNNLYSSPLPASEAFKYHRKPSNQSTRRSLSLEKLLTDRAKMRNIHQSLHTFQIKMSNRPSLTRYKLNS
jgi:hypothetical protein